MGVRLRQFMLVAPVAGLVLAALFYGLNPNPIYASGGYPADGWNAAGIVAGWCILLAGLATAAPSQISRWLALLAALPFIAGPSNPGTAGSLLFLLGFSMAGLVILVATTTVVVRTYAWKGRLAWSLGLFATGVAAASSFGDPKSPYLDNPATQVLGALLLSPVFIGLGSIWLRLDRPIAADATLRNRATLGRRFLAGVISWVSVGVIGSGLISSVTQGELLLPSPHAAIDAGLLSDAVYAAEVVLLQIVPTAIWGRTLGQWAVGVSVVRVDDGSKPGWLRSIVRFVAFQSVLVVGFVYLAALLVKLRFGAGAGVPDRLVWDHASGTLVVSAPTSSSQPSPPIERSQMEPTTRDATWESFE